ncbi:MAG: NrfD/PsrC family molybdoenzyme membrane anchor subunit [Candidatus Heimdallarchaeota archaeon]
MAVGYKFQTEWVLRRGLLLLTAMYVGAVGGATYFFSVLLNYGLGVVVGFILLGICKPLFHLAFLGRPSKFYLMPSKPGTSWISRGFVGLIFFLIFGGVVVCSYTTWTWLQGTTALLTISIISLGLSLFLVLYDGFVLASCKGIPFWNNGILPILMLTTAFIVGIACIDSLYLMLQPTPTTLIKVLENWHAFFLLLGAFLVIAFLWVATYIDVTAEKSVYVILRGNVAPIFWLTVFLAVIFPLTAVSYSLLIKPLNTFLSIIGMVELIGDFLLKYSFLRAGIYRTLVYPWSYSIVV